MFTLPSLPGLLLGAVSEPAPAALDPAIVVGVVVLALLVLAAVLLAHLNARIARLTQELAPLARLESIESAVGKLVEERHALDLRRLEHVLIDVRDGLRRLEERLVAAVETIGSREVVLARSPGEGPPRTAHLAERVTARLLTLGFERIQILTPAEELERLADGDGEVRVEARRGGAAHKGRVLLRDGAIADVRMRDTYEAFP